MCQRRWADWSLWIATNLYALNVNILVYKSADNPIIFTTIISAFLVPNAEYPAHWLIEFCVTSKNNGPADLARSKVPPPNGSILEGYYIFYLCNIPQPIINLCGSKGSSVQYHMREWNVLGCTPPMERKKAYYTSIFNYSGVLRSTVGNSFLRWSFVKYSTFSHFPRPPPPCWLPIAIGHSDSRASWAKWNLSGDLRIRNAWRKNLTGPYSIMESKDGTIR